MRYWVYIMSSHRKTLYVGVTRDLRRRVLEHRLRTRSDAFTARYRVTKLVYYDFTDDIAAAIAEEKRIKGMRRARKIELIEQQNLEWRDLAIDWFQDGR